MSRFFVLPEAEVDVQHAAKSLEAARSGAGPQFLKLLRELFVRIEGNPHLYGKVRGNVRTATIRKYHIVVFYRVLAEKTEVIAVVHGARDERTWRDRL